MQKKEQFGRCRERQDSRKGQRRDMFREKELNCNHSGVESKSRNNVLAASEVAMSSLGNTIIVEC